MTSLQPLQHIGHSLWGSPGYRLPTDTAREWHRVDSIGQWGPYMDSSLWEALLPARGHDCVFGLHAVWLPVMRVMGLREAQGDCMRYHSPVRGAYGLLEAALACERHPLTSRRPHCSVGASSLWDVFGGCEYMLAFAIPNLVKSNILLHVSLPAAPNLRNLRYSRHPDIHLLAEAIPGT